MLARSWVYDGPSSLMLACIYPTLDEHLVFAGKRWHSYIPTIPAILHLIKCGHYIMSVPQGAAPASVRRLIGRWRESRPSAGAKWSRLVAMTIMTTHDRDDDKECDRGGSVTIVIAVITHPAAIVTTSTPSVCRHDNSCCCRATFAPLHKCRLLNTRAYHVTASRCDHEFRDHRPHILVQVRILCNINSFVYKVLGNMHRPMAILQRILTLILS